MLVITLGLPHRAYAHMGLLRRRHQPAKIRGMSAILRFNSPDLPQDSAGFELIRGEKDDAATVRPQPIREVPMYCNRRCIEVLRLDRAENAGPCAAQRPAVWCCRVECHEIDYRPDANCALGIVRFDKVRPLGVDDTSRQYPSRAPFWIWPVQIPSERDGHRSWARQRDRAHRYATAHQLVRELQRHSAHDCGVFRHQVGGSHHRPMLVAAANRSARPTIIPATTAPICRQVSPLNSMGCRSASPGLNATALPLSKF
jgi:hypothetical protein